jgi:hypothetical protein
MKTLCAATGAALLACNLSGIAQTEAARGQILDAPRVPDDAKPGQTINVILEATDSGTPPLTRYQRVVVTIQ